MKKLLVLLLAFQAVPAIAGMNDATWNPPAAFDKPFDGPTIIKRLPPGDVKWACQRFSTEWKTDRHRGCARERNGTCYIITIDRPFYGTTPKAVERHERGHCNGWEH